MGGYRERRYDAEMADEEHQFDFWLGDWDVYTANGELAGRNTISRAVGETGLREEWRGKSGMVGTSLNAWDKERGVWHQTWIDSTGGVLLLDGRMKDGAMVLEGKTGDDLQRITWSVLDGDRYHVRQHWETSADGENWQTLFDGFYARAAARS